MYRDFSDKSKENLLKLVSEVEEENWCGVTDWFGDRWLDFQGWIGQLNINKYLDDLDEYYKKVAMYIRSRGDKVDCESLNSKFASLVVS